MWPESILKWRRKDRNRKVKRQNYKVGDLVWRNQKKNTPGKKAKIARHWTGPWAITETLSEITFKVKCYKTLHLLHFMVMF